MDTTKNPLDLIVIAAIDAWRDTCDKNNLNFIQQAREIASDPVNWLPNPSAPLFIPTAVWAIGNGLVEWVDAVIQIFSDFPVYWVARAATALFPVPPDLGHRVMRLDDVAGLLVHVVTNWGAQVITWQKPNAIVIVERVKERAAFWELIKKWFPGNLIWKKIVNSLWKLLILIVTISFKVHATLALLLLARELYFEFNYPDRRKEFFKAALAQDAKRVKETVKYRKRTNLRRGPDFPQSEGVSGPMDT